MCRIVGLLLFCGSSLNAWAQQDAAPPAAVAPQAASPQNVITQIRVIGNRRIPRETVLARLFSHPGDVYDPATIERDFNSLWNTGYFENLQIAREDTPKGIILDIIVKEKPTIREINYKGLNSVSTSDVLDRFKKEHVSLSVESPYDPTRLARAIDVIRALLAEHGHQFATVKPDIKTIPPSSVAINFIVKEGPTVKVGNITFTGNHAVPSRELRASMRNLRPIGIPHSIFFENLFARTYDASKLEEDTERVRRALQDRGYFRAGVADPITHIRNEGGLSFFTFRPRQGKRIDIRIPIEEGQRYRLGGVTFTGNTHVQNVKALRSQFPTKDGEWFNATAVGKGLDNLRKAYGSLGYINFTAVPTPRIDDAKHLVFLDIDIDEGKPYTVSRIEFQGNTITRDRVIRRELLLEEGQVYNSNLWEQSLLRLNQLDYFDPLKVDQDSENHTDPDNGTVSLLLKVHEKGKNSIGLNGGVSGLSGTFLGLNYSTNNFLGLGETLSVQGNIGNLSRNILFAFTEPYLRNKSTSLGFQVFSRKSDYNSARNFASVSGQSSALTAAQQSLTQNYNQSSTGLNFSISYPIKHSFKRVGLTYSWDKSTITTFSQASANLFQTLAFRSGQIQGPNALEGIYTSSVSLSYQYNKVGPSVYRPRFGTEVSAALQVAGLWGNVRYFTPVVLYKHYIAMKGLRPNRMGAMYLAFASKVPTSRVSAETSHHRSPASIPVATTNCVALMFVQPRRTHLSPCGQTLRLPIPMARRFPFSPATLRWGTSPSRSPSTGRSLSVATSRERHRSNIEFPSPGRFSLPSSTISISIRRFGSPSCGKAWRALTSSIPRFMAARPTTTALARADSPSNSITGSGLSTAPTLYRAPLSAVKSRPCCRS
jgi:outer membrane protein insertion porin family